MRDPRAEPPMNHEVDPQKKKGERRSDEMGVIEMVKTEQKKERQRNGEGKSKRKEGKYYFNRKKKKKKRNGEDGVIEMGDRNGED